MKKTAIAILALTALGAVSFAREEKTLTGVVRDESAPVIGAIVLDRENGKWASTDLNGNYSMDAVAVGDRLEITCLGYTTVNVKWDGKSPFNVVMSSEAQELEEAVVIGYGSVKKKDITGAVGVVSSRQLELQNNSMLSQKLMGSEPGLIVSRTSGAPGAGASISIRGITNMSNNNPLILIDGVAVTSIDNVAPDDVAQITVLKDAASASIYGARAASGVILITTKNAHEGEANINYTGEFSIIRQTEHAEYLTDPVNYMTFYNEWKWNDAGNPVKGDFIQYSRDYIRNYMANHEMDPITYPDFDWASAILKDYATRQKHTISATYGNKVVKTRASAMYETTDGMYEGLGHERYMIRTRSDINIARRLTASVDLSLKNATLYNPQSGSPLKASRMYPAIYAGTYPSGRISAGKTGSNTLAALLYGGTNNKTNTYITSNISLSWKPLDGLSLSATISPVYSFTSTKSMKHSIPYYDAYDPSLLLGYISNYENNRLGELRENTVSMQKQFVVNYEKTIASKHRLNAMAGYEDYTFKQETEGANSSDMEIEDFPYLDLANKNSIAVSGSAYETAYRSFFGRLMYNYDSRYYLQVNARADASSRFHKDYRWGFFPSASLGWVVSNEPFMKNVKPVSYLKLRASLGSLGNERIGNYPYQQSINYEKVVMFNGAGASQISKATGAQVDYAVRDITWETTWNWDAGIDATFFDSRLSFGGDLYYKETRDMLLDLSIPLFTGFGSPSQNAGSMYTRGWEVKLGWKDKIGDISYSVSANLTDYTSIMKDLKGVKFAGDQLIAEGEEYNSWYGFVSDGLFQNAAEVAAGPTYYASAKPGDIRYTDIDGDGSVTAAKDKKVLGSSLPHYIYGANVNVGWKGLNLSVLISGVGKKNNMISEDMICPFESQWLAPPANLLNPDGSRNYWSVYNTESENRAVKYPRLSYTGAKNNNYLTSDYWLVDGSYMRVKDINLSYTFPKRLISRIGLSQLRVFFDVADPFCFDNYLPGWDPEGTVSSYISTTYTIGTSIRF